MPLLPSLPSPGVAVQQIFNVLTTVASNTPIRGLLDALAPASSTSAVSAVRLPGQPVGTTMSADGTRAVVTTAPFSPLALFLPVAYSVAVIDTRTNTLVGIPIAIEGNPTGPAILSPDGTRAFQTTSGPSGQTTRVTVIDTANGTGVNAVDLTGSIGLLRVTPDGNHVFAETMGPTGVTVTMLDGRTGAVTGAPHEISGTPIGGPVFIGTRAYQTTISSGEGSSTTTVTQFDTLANAILDSITFDGVADGGVVISPDGAIAAQVTHDPFAWTVTTVTLFDPDTGEVVAAPLSLEGNHDPYFPALFSNGGDRLSIATISDGIHSSLFVIDTETGATIAPAITLAGYSSSPKGAEVFGLEANLLYVAADPLSGTAQTAVIVVDTVDGTVVGSPLLLDGQMGGTHRFSVSPDRTRVFQTLSTEGATTVAVVGADGSLISTSNPINGYAATPVEFSADGSRAYQSTRGTESMVSAIDTTTGRVVGSPVSVKGDYGDQLFIADGGNRVYNTTSVVLLEFGIPFFLPPYFFLYFGVGMSSVNAIDAAAF